MVIAFGTKEARDALMVGQQKLDYPVSPRDLEDLNSCTAPTEVVIAFPNDTGWLTLTPSGMELADWVERFGADSLKDGSWVDNLTDEE